MKNIKRLTLGLALSIGVGSLSSQRSGFAKDPERNYAPPIKVVRR